MTDRGQSRDQLGRLSVTEAADRLGITEAAVRKRVRRGQIPHDRDDRGRVWVWLSPDETRRIPSRDRDKQSRDRRIEDLLDQVRYLRELLNEERESRRLADAVIAQLSQANAEQARTIRALEAPASRGENHSPSEPSESPETVAEMPMGDPKGPEPTEARAEAQGAQGERSFALKPQGTPRSWWRRVFGG
jgi:predicted transcriptional regulator